MTIVLLKWNGQMLIKWLWAVLWMLFMYLCPHLVRRQTLKSLRASRALQYVGHYTKTCHFPLLMFDFQSTVLKIFKPLFGWSRSLPLRKMCRAISGSLIFYLFIRITNVNVCVWSTLLPTYYLLFEKVLNTYIEQIWYTVKDKPPLVTLRVFVNWEYWKFYFF